MPGGRSLTLAHGFKQTDAGGDGDVEALDASGHGDFGEEIAVLTREAAHAGAFGAHDDADGAFEIDLVKGLGGFVSGSDEPDAELLQFFHGADEVGDADDGDVLGAAAGDAVDGVGDGGGLVLGQDDGGDAGGVGGAEAGAEVVRVLDAIENEDERVGMAGEERFEVAFVVDVAEGFAGGGGLAVAVLAGGAHGGTMAEGGAGASGAQGLILGSGSGMGGGRWRSGSVI